MDVRKMNLDQMIEHGYLVKVSAIIEVTGKVYVHLTEIDGTEQLYKYVPEPDFMGVKCR